MKLLKLTVFLLIFTSFAYAAEPKKVFTASINEQGVQVVEMTGGEYYFDPNYVILKANVPVELRVKKTAGIVPHNIVIEAPDAGVNLKEAIGREPKTFRFTLKKHGKYRFYCDKKLLFFKSHREKGMGGTIEAVE